MKIVSACLAGMKTRYDGKSSPNRKVIHMVKTFGGEKTKELVEGAKEALRIAKECGAKEAILASKSPSCGCGKIYDGSFSGKLRDGDGVTTALFKRNGIKVVTEEEL